MAECGGTIICGPDGFRIQGERKISRSEFEVFSPEKCFKIKCAEIDRLVLIPPASVVPAPPKSSIQRRYASTYVPPTWYTIGIATKALLFFEISVPSLKERMQIFTALSDYSPNVTSAVSSYKKISERCLAMEDAYGPFLLQDHFSEVLDSGICRISEVNFNNQVCETYPTALVVPAAVSDDILKEAANSRRSGRFPVIKYFYPGKSTFLATAGELLRPPSKVNQLPDDALLSASSQFYRANKQLLEAMLPKTSGRGLIIDLRGDSASITSSTTSKTKKNGNRPQGDISPIVEANLPAHARKRWKIVPRRRDTNQYDPGWTRVSKPLPDVGEIFSIFSDFFQGVTRTTENSISQIPKVPSLSNFFPTRNEDISSPSRSSGAIDNATNGGGGDFTGVKVSMKKTSRWLSLVRDVLSVANAGACALDARDQAAHQQLNHDKSVLSRKIAASGEDVAVLKERLRSMQAQGSSVVVVGEGEGRDRTLLISSLIQVILSPAVRTIRGFEGLIQHDWISAGHRFSDRCSHILPSIVSTSEPPALSAKPLQGRDPSPIFLLFLDCVWQIWCQFPGSFEFNEYFLLLLGEHVYVSDFDTFRVYDGGPRNPLNRPRETTSLWSHIDSSDVFPRIQNPLFSPTSDTNPESTPCWPCLSPQAINIWRELYQRIVLPYPCCVWSDQREALITAYNEYSEASATVQQLERTIQELMAEPELLASK